MAEGRVHTVYSDGRWKNKIEGAAPLPGWYDRQEIAAEAGRAHAMRRHAEHVVRNQDGTIALRASYPGDSVYEAPQAEGDDSTGLPSSLRRLADHLLERHSQARGFARSVKLQRLLRATR
jgi:uncharacterized protein DUF2188